MINTKFEAYKIKRELKRNSISYEIKRAKKNEFGEATDDLISIGKLNGLYHEQNMSIRLTTGDTTQIRTKKIPMILCLYEDANSLALQVNDIINFNSKTFKIIGNTNIQEWNIISDISLEVIDNGIQAWLW